MRGHSWHGEGDEAPATEEERLQREAQRRARREMEFIQHLAVFVPVMLLVLAIDVLAGDDWFVHWVAFIWGGILLVHFLHSFVLHDLLGPAMERRLTARQLRRLEERGRHR